MEKSAETSKLEVADILNEYIEDYRLKYYLSPRERKIVDTIIACRTEECGLHIDQCQNCGHQEMYYNSCCNRHCPKCQQLKKSLWLLARKSELLPVKYFHMIFTIPDTLNSLTLKNKKLMYDILFKATHETVRDLGWDDDHLGAQTGCIAVLHTWGQKLDFHPHLHLIVPAGGLSDDGIEWIESNGNYFAPVGVMSSLFRGKFLYYLKKEYKANNLKNNMSARDFESFLTMHYKKNWVVNVRKPFAKPEHVIDYLGNYTHRVAISNYRLIKLENHKVYFRYKDYRDKSRKKVIKLDAVEFIRRFLMHILPHRYCKIRYTGLLANRYKRENIELCRQILLSYGKKLNEDFEINHKDKDWKQLVKELFDYDPEICPKCGGKMLTLVTGRERLKDDFT